MKQRLLMSVVAVVLFSLTIAMVVSCKKQKHTEMNDQTLLIKESDAMLEHILDFKNSMEYHKANPGLKNGMLYTAPDAVEELESLINLTFCYIDIEVNKKKFVKTEVIMPLDALHKIGESKLAQLYYEEIIDSIRAQMLLINYANMKLLLVDLEQTGTDSNGDAIVSVGALVGNEGNISPGTTEDGWWYGFLGGNCEHEFMGENDAALCIQLALQFAHIIAPPPGYIRRAKLIATVGPLTPTDYRIQNDPLDNYMDYMIFYADAEVDTINNDVRCLSNDVEIPFYRHQYDSLIHKFQQQYQLDFVDCIVEGYTEEEEPYIQHNYSILLGNVWYIQEDWAIDDIMCYDN